MLKQLNVYAENKKGTLEKITRILLEHDINILGSMSDDGAEFGINRMVVSDPKTAAESLQKAGFMIEAASHAKQVPVPFIGRSAIDKKCLVRLRRIYGEGNMLHGICAEPSRIFISIGTFLPEGEPDSPIPVDSGIIQRLCSGKMGREDRCGKDCQYFFHLEIDSFVILPKRPK